MSRYFHLYADGKTVREISQEEYIDISRKWRGSARPRRLVAVSQTGLWIERGPKGVWVPLEQLLEVLRRVGAIPAETKQSLDS